MSAALTFPPLLWGEVAPSGAVEQACLRAAQGCDAGLVTYRITATEIEAALVFAPEVPLATAIAMLPLCGVGFQNALGALAPPEVSVHLGWDGVIYVNGARCGRLRAVASDPAADQVPDWLVVGFSLPLLPPNEETGLTPDQTALYAEGCADVAPDTLVEAWARHTLSWISRWEADGGASLHEEWRGLAWQIGERVEYNGETGQFLGIDEHFGMLLRGPDCETCLLPLTELLEVTP